MATFKERIEDMAGTTPTTLITGAQACADGVRDVVDKIIKYMPGLVPLFTDETTVATHTIADTGLPILSARVQCGTDPYYEAHEIPQNRVLASQQSTSIYFATATSPVYYRDGNKSTETLQFQPSASIANVVLVQVVHGAVTNWDAGTSSIINFPESWYDAVIMYAAARYVLNTIAETGIAYSVVNGYIVDDEDTELASAELSRQGLTLSEYQWLVARYNQLMQQYNGLFAIPTNA
jgi:hypothetical protein